MRYHNTSKPLFKPKQRGITLLESLVAIVVLALGVLGILGTQIKTLTTTQETNYRAAALKLIDDLSELMKIQPDAIAMQALYTTAGSTDGAESACKDNQCNAEQLANSDFAKWNEKLPSFLPQGEATVFQTGDEKQIGVLIQWLSSDKNTSAINALITEDLEDINGNAITCKDGYACHLQYVSLIRRCIEENGTYFCAEN